MTKRRISLNILLFGFLSFFVVNLSFAAGILGFQPGDRSPTENSNNLKKAVGFVELAIKEVKKGNGKISAEHAQAALDIMREINSEGWAPTLEMSGSSIRRGLRAATKGKLEFATSQYQRGIDKMGKLKFGDMNWTHEAFLGIGDRRNK